MIEFVLRYFICNLLVTLIGSVLFLFVRIVVGIVMYAIEGVNFIRRRIIRCQI